MRKIAKNMVAKIWNTMRSDKIIYYKHFFPILWAQCLRKVATCNEKYPLAAREISPRWETKEGETIMSRHLIFWTDKELIDYCIEKLPDSLQFGGILPLFGRTERLNDYEFLLADKEVRVRAFEMIKQDLISAYGEVVLDIDIDDYNRNGICECRNKSKCQWCTTPKCGCSRRLICNICWTTFIEPARKVLHYIIEDHFHFHNLVDIWSGQRGMHMWLLDMRIIEWTNEQRKQFIYTLRHPECSPFGDHVYEKILLPLFLDNRVLRGRSMVASRAAVERELYPKLDHKVTESRSHLVGTLLGCHQASGFWRIPLPPHNGKHTFNPEIDSFCPSEVENLGNYLKRFMGPILRVFEGLDVGK